MNIYDFWDAKRKTAEILKEIDENMKKAIDVNNEMKRQVNELFYKAVRSADKERIFTFKIKDFAEEFKKLTGIKICAQLESTGGYCCKGHIATKEELLEKCGDEKVTYFVKFNEGKIGSGICRECDMEIKLTDILPNGKRLIDFGIITPWTSENEKRTYLKLPKLEQEEIKQLVVFVSPHCFLKDEERKSGDEKAFETAVSNASVKQNERAKKGEGKE